MHEVKAWAQQGGGRKGGGNGEKNERGVEEPEKQGQHLAGAVSCLQRGKKNKTMKPNQKPCGKSSSEPQGASWRVGGGRDW